MYLFYADESGSISDPSQRFFILAGLSVFERETHWIEQELNQIASRFESTDPHSVELHGSPMRSGSHGWKQYPREDREAAIVDALTQGIQKRHPKQVRLFGAVLEKAHFSGKDIAQIAFEQVSSRFDMFLGRLYRQSKDSQRGLILFDKSATEQRIQTLAREFKYSGHSFGVTRNYAEVPVFVDSRASRLIQLANLVAYALFRRFEHEDFRSFRVIEQCFDSEGCALQSNMGSSVHLVKLADVSALMARSLFSSFLQYSQPKQIEARSAVHLPFDQLESMDLSLYRAIAPGQMQGSFHGFPITCQSGGKAA